MQGITPHLWYDQEAKEAAELYTSIFPDSKITSVTTLPGTPGGDSDVVSFELMGQPFMAISAGPYFTFTPAISFAVSCATPDEVDEYWARLSPGGTVLMPLAAYPFSTRYGWTTDRYGLSWQISLPGEGQGGRRITPMLLFVSDVAGKAEEAITFYASLFPDSKIGLIMRYGPGEEPDREGTIKYGAFALQGEGFAAMDSAQEHQFGFNEAISLLVNCENQDEIDRYWDALSAVPDAEQCGWLKDRFGVSWQISPAAMFEMLTNGTKEQVARVVETFMPMKKLDLAQIQRAYEGS